jgi:Fungal specific transcription factor domain
MARLATFIAIDHERKVREVRSQEKQNHPLSPLSTPPITPDSQPSDPLSSMNSLLQACQEWETLVTDFTQWFESLEPLRQRTLRPETPTPFGCAVVYIDVRVGAAEMLYLASRVLLNRAHPSLPSDRPGSVAQSAQVNAPFLVEIVNIAEGFWDPGFFNNLDAYEDGRNVVSKASDYVVSALCNCAWPFFVAGAQVKDSEQRKFMANRLIEIYELSGFATAVTPFFVELIIAESPKGTGI